MEFDEEAGLDTSAVDDVRGQGGAGGGFSLPSGGMVGGGLVGLLLVVVLGFLGINGDLSGLTGDSSAPQGDERGLQEKCAISNPDRFAETDCRQLATFNDLRAYWRGEAARGLDVNYTNPRLVLFSSGVNTGCGFASSAVGPFYCPADQRIYIDLSFYNQLARDFGAPGEFAQAYVLAHEFGHHLQYLTGAERQVRRLQQRDPGRANLYSIALELQADCYAGVWTKGASGPDGLITGVSQQDLASALEAARAVGDDRIQQKTQGQATPETWTHGSAEQRESWFFQGYQTGDPQSCDTFARL